MVHRISVLASCHKTQWEHKPNTAEESNCSAQLSHTTSVVPSLSLMQFLLPPWASLALPSVNVWIETGSSSSLALKFCQLIMVLQFLFWAEPCITPHTGLANTETLTLLMSLGRNTHQLIFSAVDSCLLKSKLTLRSSWCWDQVSAFFETAVLSPVQPHSSWALWTHTLAHLWSFSHGEALLVSHRGHTENE